MPDQLTTRLQHPGKLGDDLRVVGGIEKKPKRREQIEHGVKAAGPLGGKLPHVAAGVAEGTRRAAFARDGEEVRRVVESIDVEPSFGEQMRVTPLPAGHVEDSRAAG